MLLRFRRAIARRDAVPPRNELAGELDPTFLWEVSGEGEFGFDELARDYYGTQPTAPQQAARSRCCCTRRRCISTSVARAATARRPTTR